MRLFKRPTIVICCALAALIAAPSASPAPVNVTQHHNDAARDGLYVDPAFTQTAAANLTRDLNFDGTISGSVYAQPLYIEGGPGGLAMVIAVTESNNIYALNAADGSIIWQDNVGPPVPLPVQPCGNINPLGITGTPVVDLPSRSLLLDALTTPDGGATARHLIYSLNVDTGATNSGWPVDVNATATSGGTAFTSATQNERGALAILNGTVYVPYGGHWGDCGTYYGWLVGIPLDNPSNVTAWATTANKGGCWAVGGVASDGTNIFIATGNTYGASVWSGGEAIIRFQPGPSFSGSTLDYWAPTNWSALDDADLDIGGSGPLLVTVPGATPSDLIVALGKDGNAYLLDRNNLGGISAPAAQAQVAYGNIIQAAAAYQTSIGTYVAFTDGSGLDAFRITTTSPPSIVSAWIKYDIGGGSPFVTSTDGTNNVIVWAVGAGGDNRLHGYDGDTGAVIYSGGGANELMAGAEPKNTAIAARGRIYVANDNKVYAFTVPVPPLTLTNLTVSAGGSFQFGFTNIPGMTFTVLSTTDISQPLTNWTRLGVASEVAPGQFQFTDTQPASPQTFYRVRSP